MTSPSILRFNLWRLYTSEYQRFMLTTVFNSKVVILVNISSYCNETDLADLTGIVKQKFFLPQIFKFQDK